MSVAAKKFAQHGPYTCTSAKKLAQQTHTSGVFAKKLAQQAHASGVFAKKLAQQAQMQRNLGVFGALGELFRAVALKQRRRENFFASSTATTRNLNVQGHYDALTLST